MLGADDTWPPERVVALFDGDESGVNRPRRQLWYDFGVVEFFWNRTKTGRSWSGTHFSVQAHRLAHDVAPAAAITRRYGPFAGAVTFAALSAELDRRAVALVARPVVHEDLREYWHPTSCTSVFVIEGSYYGRPGDVYRVASPVFTTPESRESARYRRRAND
ncbi:hypothetical protein ABZU76_49440 [Amycolatopsis sp. NPDC005232]|uniref:hypothetical protein n=1 Tax=Amycolatopsis sp. NPDC005232 TaxID=3157027 RepID=UPI0033B2E150